MMKSLAILLVAVFHNCLGLDLEYFFGKDDANVEEHVHEKHLRTPAALKRYTVMSTSAFFESICQRKQLRFVTFGGRTAASGGANAYPHLLCNGTNLAYDNSIPGDIADCFKTIMGDHHFDVFVLDFFTVADQGLDRLIMKIKDRFPRAIIILIQDYLPVWTGYQSAYGWINVAMWASANHVPDLSSESLIKFSFSQEPWELFDYTTQAKALNDAIKPAGGWILYRAKNVDFQNLNSSEVKDVLLNNFYLYDNWDVYSQLGAVELSEQILQIAHDDDFSRSSITYSWYKEADPAKCFPST